MSKDYGKLGRPIAIRVYLENNVPSSVDYDSILQPASPVGKIGRANEVQVKPSLSGPVTGIDYNDRIRYSVFGDYNSRKTLAKTRLGEIVFRFNGYNEYNRTFFPLHFFEYGRSFNIPVAKAFGRVFGDTQSLNMFEVNLLAVDVPVKTTLRGKSSYNLNLTGSFQFALRDDPNTIAAIPETIVSLVLLNKLEDSANSSRAVAGPTILAQLPLAAIMGDNFTFGNDVLFENKQNAPLIKYAKEGAWRTINIPVDKDIVLTGGEEYRFVLYFTKGNSVDMIKEGTKHNYLSEKYGSNLYGQNDIYLLSGSLSGLVDLTMDVSEATSPNIDEINGDKIYGY